MANVGFNKERFLRYEIKASPAPRGKKGFSMKFKQFREALKLSLDGIAKKFDYLFTTNGEDVISFYVPEDKEDLVDEKFARLQNRYFRKR